MATPPLRGDSGVCSFFSVRRIALEEAFGASDYHGDRKSCTDIHILLDHPRKHAANVDTGAPHARVGPKQ
jgi:hypothetical protein